MSSNPAPPGVHSFVWKRLDEAEARVKQLESERKVLERRLARLEGGVPPNELRAHVSHEVQSEVFATTASLVERVERLELGATKPEEPSGLEPSMIAAVERRAKAERQARGLPADGPEPDPVEAVIGALWDAAISDSDIPTPAQNQARAEKQIPPPAAPSQPRGKRV